jgi:hypothetical protein
VEVHDTIVVGSGPAGAMAAQTIVESGRPVTMVDVGFDAPEGRNLVPAEDFLVARRTDAEQYRYLLGEQAEGVTWGEEKGENLTPPRRYLMSGTERLTPVASASFRSFESLGYGGLGIAWGLGCWQFSAPELRACGLEPKRMRAAYAEINRRIGISAERDDLAPHAIDADDRYQPAPRIDRLHSALLAKYRSRRGSLRSAGFAVGRPAMALLTEDLDDRRSNAYNEMDFYADLDGSAWRPWMTVDSLRAGGRLDYRRGLLASRFVERSGRIDLECIAVEDGERGTLSCRRLLPSAGALGSARIVLRSVAPPGIRSSLLCNPYSYVPCLVPREVGRNPDRHRHALCQLAVVHDRWNDRSDVAIAGLYSYQSLMLFRIVGRAPLNLRDATQVLRYLMTGFVIMGLQLPDVPAREKYVVLEEDRQSLTGDRLRAEWAVDDETARSHRSRGKLFLRTMRRLGAHPLRVIDPGPGGSIHYAGTLPFSEEPAPGRLWPDGRVHGTRAVFVADSSGFNYLPAKGHTWSLMANAHLTAQAALGR